MKEQATSSIPANSLPSSSERSSSSGALQLEVKEGMESDEEIRRVPEMGGVEPGGTSAGGGDTAVASGGQDRGAQPVSQSQRKGGRSPADRENKRLKRLLRNRVSAQQARERKKAYVSELEVKAKDLEKKYSELEERVSTLQNENQMLRHVHTEEHDGRQAREQWRQRIELRWTPVRWRRPFVALNAENTAVLGLSVRCFTAAENAGGSLATRIHLDIPKHSRIGCK